MSLHLIPGGYTVTHRNLIVAENVANQAQAVYMAKEKSKAEPGKSYAIHRQTGKSANQKGALEYEASFINGEQAPMFEVKD